MVEILRPHLEYLIQTPEFIDWLCVSAKLGQGLCILVLEQLENFSLEYVSLFFFLTVVILA